MDIITRQKSGVLALIDERDTLRGKILLSIVDNHKSNSEIAKELGCKIGEVGSEISSIKVNTSYIELERIVIDGSARHKLTGMRSSMSKACECNFETGMGGSSRSVPTEHDEVYMKAFAMMGGAQ